MKPVDPSQRTAEVLRLGLVEGVGVRAIARRLGMARKTIRKILGRAVPKATAIAARTSLLDPYDKAIRTILDDSPEMLAPAVLERLRPLGYTGGVTILRDRLRRIRAHSPREAFLTLHFEPGAAMQVDWADFGFALPGVARRVSAFVAALCYSRYLYIEFTVSQSFGSLVRCMERCLRFYGGTTEVDIFDNMKTVVLSHTPFNTDDVLGTGVNKMFRVPFDRNRYSVPWRLASQQVIVRADDEHVAVFLGTKCVAQHPRCWDVGQDIEDPSHKRGLLDEKPRRPRRLLAPRARWPRRRREPVLQALRRQLEVGAP